MNAQSEKAPIGAALITGASGGIGYELAKRFARDGYNLVLVARNQQSLSHIAAELFANIIPGLRNKILAWSVRLGPRKLVPSLVRLMQEPRNGRALQ